MIVAGMHSEKSKFTQYRVQKDEGEAFVELEEELAALPPSTSVESSPLIGTWEGVLHGFQGDSPFAFYFRRHEQKLAGVFSLQWGGSALKSVTLENNALEIYMDTPIGKFRFDGALKQDALSGKWSE